MLTSTMTPRTEAPPRQRLIVSSSPTLAVVVPLFNEVENLPELYSRLTQTLENLGLAYEILFVNDGSSDGTSALLDELCDSDPNVTVIHLSRNFGHQPAITAGLEHARADAIVVMDGDMQDPPEVIPALVERWREGYDVAYAIRTQRKENALRRSGYYLFYRLLKSISNVPMPVDSGDFCLMDRRVARAINRMPEHDRFVRGLRSYVGFKQIGVTYERPARSLGESKYTMRKLIGLAVSGVVSMSDAPVRLLTATAVVLISVAILASLGIVGYAAITAVAPAGWLVVSVIGVLLTGLQFGGLALLGLYVSRIFAEVRKRPAYVVSEIRGRR